MRNIVLTIMVFFSFFSISFSKNNQGSLTLKILSKKPGADMMFEVVNLKYQCDYDFVEKRDNYYLPLPKESKRICILSGGYKEAQFLDKKKGISFSFDESIKRKISISFYAPADLLINLPGMFDVTIICPENLMIRQSNPVRKSKNQDEYVFKKSSVINIIIEKNTRQNNLLLILFFSVIFLLFAGHSLKKYLLHDWKT
ncbi:hypothetical protein KAJ27_13190 [bacterium]|nr:hypothetical protein [bacterium]